MFFVSLVETIDPISNPKNLESHSSLLKTSIESKTLFNPSPSDDDLARI